MEIFKIECKICNKFFEHHLKGKEKWKLNCHLKKEHNIDAKEYLLKINYNGIHPLCACGCGTKVKYDKFHFNKYFENHKDYVKTPLEVIEKVKLTHKLNIDKKFAKLNISYEKLVELFNSYKNLSKNYRMIQEETGIDKRTIIHYWKYFNLTFKDELIRLSKIHKKSWSSYSSKKEKDLGDILKYYFGSKNVNMQFRLENKKYDFLLYNRILVEFDGTYWHSRSESKINDKIKTDLAKKYNYKLIRIKEEDAKNILVLLDLKKQIENEQIQIKTDR